MPSKINEKIIVGERMSRTDSILESCVPAFIKTMVPVSIPIWLTKKKDLVFIGVRPMTRLMTKKGTTGIRRSVKR